MEMIDWALTYADRGWAVFPVNSIVDGKCTCGRTDCQNPGKHPAIAGGFKPATKDPQLIKFWWGGGAPRNIGIATGDVSGLLVIDVDVSPTTNGFESLAHLESQYGRLSDTLSVRTGSGGRHLYFQMPASDVRNSAGRLGRGIDVRANGGYVLAPPSLHFSGKQYTWENFS